MASDGFAMVTGAFGYSGKYIATRLLARGKEVRTLTGSRTRPDPFGGRVKAFPFNFDDPAALTESLRGAIAVYNTYWVRFDYGGTTFAQAVANTGTLIRAARDAGVQRFVHVSITSPSEDSTLPYFRGKAELERELRDSGLSYAIVRPTVIFGREDILINNIAWLLRRLPVFVVPGSGEYRLQPVFADDMAEIAVEMGTRRDNVTVDAVGPEVYTFNDLVRLIKRTIRSRAAIVHAPAGLALAMSSIVGRLVKDVVLTRDEVLGLQANLLVSAGKPTGHTLLSDWLSENSATVGQSYSSEVARHFVSVAPPL